MFTGIIENVGMVSEIIQDKSNVHYWIVSPISNQLKVDQSVSHNGVCLTVVEIRNEAHRVTAIDETLKKTNLKSIKTGDLINLERCMIANGRFDGHIVQGHVDQIGKCVDIKDESGSTKFTFAYDSSTQNITVEKGSICINGVSLTVVESKANSFSVYIIPYTLEHTNLKSVKLNDEVNLEFDIIGKYLAKLIQK